MADVLVTVNDWSANTYTISVNRGSDGVQLWQESGSGNAWISGAQDLNGDRYVDLLVTISNWPSSIYKVIAKKGNDGADLWQESVTGSAWIEARPAKDLNGDRIDDMVVTIHNWGTNTHTAIAKKGSDGTNLWQETVTGYGSWLYATPTDDFNGDRTGDVLVTTNNWATYTYNVTAKRGSDGTNLWQDTVTGYGLWLYATPTDDLNGDRTSDVLVTTGNWPTSTYSVKAKKGSDGANLWQALSNTNIWGTSIGDLDRDRRENTLVSSSNNIYAVGVPK